ncbi:30S ribosomal protein S12, partial [Candidatus Liberibacter asiaticus]
MPTVNQLIRKPRKGSFRACAKVTA